jgi:hypothetical protein
MRFVDFLRQQPFPLPCPACDALLPCQDAHLLSRDDCIFHVHIQCAVCRAQVMAVLHFHGEFDDPNTDQTAPDPSAGLLDKILAETLPAPPIEADEVLDVRNHLRDWNGPLADLIPPSGA